MIRIGIDTGGTFTDFVSSSRRAGARSQGPLDARRSGARRARRDPRAARLRTAPATPATRRDLPRLDRRDQRGARARGRASAWSRRAGFEDVLEIGRQTRPELYDLEPRSPTPLVPRGLRLGVVERMRPTVACLTPPSTPKSGAWSPRLRGARRGRVAVCLLHSYANPRTSARLAEAPRRPASASRSHQLLPEYREFERTSTTVVNAYVAPVMGRHLVRASSAAPGARLRVMQSNGGRDLGARRRGAGRADHPLRAGGRRGRRAGEWPGRAGCGASSPSTWAARRPTSRCRGRARCAITTESTVGGLPVRLPMIDIHTVGAGGGSIARVDAGGALQVGPRERRRRSRPGLLRPRRSSRR